MSNSRPDATPRILRDIFDENGDTFHPFAIGLMISYSVYSTTPSALETNQPTTEMGHLGVWTSKCLILDSLLNPITIVRSRHL